MNLQTISILHRIVAIAGNHDTEIDEDAMRQFQRDADYKLMKGWTANEIVSLFRNVEDVNPTLDEHVAIANMSRITKEVEARLAG